MSEKPSDFRFDRDYEQAHKRNKDIDKRVEAGEAFSPQHASDQLEMKERVEAQEAKTKALQELRGICSVKILQNVQNTVEIGNHDVMDYYLSFWNKEANITLDLIFASEGRTKTKEMPQLVDETPDIALVMHTTRQVDDYHFLDKVENTFFIYKDKVIKQTVDREKFGINKGAAEMDENYYQKYLDMLDKLKKEEEKGENRQEATTFEMKRLAGILDAAEVINV
jgi:hypothetical protein